METSEKRVIRKAMRFVFEMADKSLSKFGLIFSGQAFSLMGSRLVQFCLVWYLTLSSGSATTLAIASMMALFPQIVIGPIAGAYVDRWNRKRVMIIADTLVAFGVILLILLFHYELIQIWHIYLLMLLRAIGGAFHWPAMQASIPLIVPEKHLTRVSGLNQSLQGLASIIAPPLGALLLEFFPLQQILFLDVITAGMAILPLLFMLIPQPIREIKESQKITQDLREAIDFALLWKGGLIVIVGAMLGNLLATPAFALVPLLVKDYFNGGAIELAYIQSAWGLGMVLGGGALGVWGGFKRKVVTAMSATILMGAGFIIVGLVPSTMFIVAVAAVFLAGLMNPIINGSLFAAVQTTVPSEMQGRYFTLLLSGSAAMTPVGLAIAGPFADFLGIRIWFQLGGIIFILLGLISFFIPVIMKMEDFKYQNMEVEDQ